LGARREARRAKAYFPEVITADVEVGERLHAEVRDVAAERHLDRVAEKILGDDCRTRGRRDHEALLVHPFRESLPGPTHAGWKRTPREPPSQRNDGLREQVALGELHDLGMVAKKREQGAN
jgi:hypothetical protein